MIRRALRIGAVLLVGLGLVMGCGSSDRPSELSLSDVEPCGLIPRSALEQLHATVEPQPFDSPPGINTEGVSCFYLLRTGTSVTVSAITNHGIGRWIDSSFEDARFKDVPRIQGYRTIQVWYTYDRAEPHNTCRLYVDVADGQSLKVQVSANAEDDPPTCDTARQFAETAMQTLVNQN